MTPSSTAPTLFAVGEHSISTVDGTTAIAGNVIPTNRIKGRANATYHSEEYSESRTQFCNSHLHNFAVRVINATYQIAVIQSVGYPDFIIRALKELRRRHKILARYGKDPRAKEEALGEAGEFILRTLKSGFSFTLTLGCASTMVPGFPTISRLK